jgi:hypothetical protein
MFDVTRGPGIGACVLVFCNKEIYFVLDFLKTINSATYLKKGSHYHIGSVNKF